MDDNIPGSVIEPLETTSQPEPTPNLQPAEPSTGSGSPKKKSWRRRLKEFSNLYFIIFALVFLLAIAGTVVQLTWNRNQAAKKSSSLTSEQLAQLQGNTTLVGDSKQTLDIQGNTILEGQLLVRKDAEIAGSIKVGGGLSLSSITVGEQSNVGQLQVNGILSVSGDTTFSGQLSVQKNLNVSGSGTFGGNLTAAKLTITSLQINGDFQINRHITLGGSIPSKSNGSALGSGGTASVNGADTAGTVTINTGSSPPAGCFVTINFAAKFNVTPHVVISPSNSSSAGLNYYTNRSTSSFSICTTNTPSASTTYLFDYIIIG
ncbi:MAG TPA: polymer-forming cytoskeletal protein [Candidatus Saccharimonadales bacterium]